MLIDLTNLSKSFKILFTPYKSVLMRYYQLEKRSARYQENNEVHVIDGSTFKIELVIELLFQSLALPNQRFIYQLF